MALVALGYGHVYQLVRIRRAKTGFRVLTILNIAMIDNLMDIIDGCHDRLAYRVALLTYA
jgi:hypothetical protein